MRIGGMCTWRTSSSTACPRQPRSRSERGEELDVFVGGEEARVHVHHRPLLQLPRQLRLLHVVLHHEGSFTLVGGSARLESLVALVQ